MYVVLDDEVEWDDEMKAREFISPWEWFALTNFFPCMTFHQFSLLSPFHRL